MSLEESIKLAVQGCGVELYDIVKTKEHKDNIYRIYISSKDGISLDKCVQVSQMVSPILDINEPINGQYKLEVSSPGIERRLKTLSHFLLSIGEYVKIKEYSTQTLQGLIVSANTNGDIEVEKNNTIHKINFEDILSASTYYNQGIKNANK